MCRRFPSHESNGVDGIAFSNSESARVDDRALETRKEPIHTDVSPPNFANSNSTHVEVKCPCGSDVLFRDGVRHSGINHIQRYLCRKCGRRFSESRQADSRDSKTYCVREPKNPQERKLAQFSLQNTAGDKLTAELKTVGGDKKTSKTASEFRQQLKNDNKSESTIRNCCNLISRLESEGIDPLKPEEVKKFIAEQKWREHSKATMVIYYGIFLEYLHIQWKPPTYTYRLNKVKAPLEADVNALISGSSRKMSVCLTIAKECGFRIGEILRLVWTDVDFERNLIILNAPEKNSDSRAAKMSPTLKAMLGAMPRKGKRIFTCTMNSMYSSFRRQRRRTAFKLKNDRLIKITFHDFRRFFATKHYGKYLDVLKTAEALGLRNINNVRRYIDTQDYQSDDYEVQVAETVEEAKKLGEAGFEHYDTIDSRHLYRKRKL